MKISSLYTTARLSGLKPCHAAAAILRLELRQLSSERCQTAQKSRILSQHIDTTSLVLHSSYLHSSSSSSIRHQVCCLLMRISSQMYTSQLCGILHLLKGCSVSAALGQLSPLMLLHMLLLLQLGRPAQVSLSLCGIYWHAVQYGALSFMPTMMQASVCTASSLPMSVPGCAVLALTRCHS